MIPEDATPAGEVFRALRGEYLCSECESVWLLEEEFIVNWGWCNSCWAKSLAEYEVQRGRENTF